MNLPTSRGGLVIYWPRRYFQTRRSLQCRSWVKYAGTPRRHDCRQKAKPRVGQWAIQPTGRVRRCMADSAQAHRCPLCHCSAPLSVYGRSSFDLVRTNRRGQGRLLLRGGRLLLGFVRDFVRDHGHDPDLELGLDFMGHVHIDGVQAQFL